jgi:hypothetical protein
MFLTDQSSIREVLTFPMMRDEKTAAKGELKTEVNSSN